jgi:hypothetical protein
MKSALEYHDESREQQQSQSSLMLDRKSEVGEKIANDASLLFSKDLRSLGMEKIRIRAAKTPKCASG